MKRRTFLKTGAAVLAAPAIVRAQSTRVLRFVPEADVVIFDPIVTPSWQTRDHSFLVYDTLFGLDDKYSPQPQMLEGYNVSSDGLTWTLTLREGLRFHDNEPVRAQDAVASIRRWGIRDSFGQALMAAAHEVSAANDRTVTIRLKKPFPLLPERAREDHGVPVHGDAGAPRQARCVQGGAPRSSAADRTASCRASACRVAPRLRAIRRLRAAKGRHGVDVGRAEGHALRPHRVARSSRTGHGRGSAPARRDRLAADADTDLIPVLRKNKNIDVQVILPHGVIAYMRFNQLTPPFDNPAIRRALYGAVNQADYMIAINGADKTLWRDASATSCPARRSRAMPAWKSSPASAIYAKVKKDLEAAGYKGEKVVMLVAVNIPYLKIMGEVTADLFKRIGMNVDYQAIDWTTLVQRRTKMDPSGQGGWNLFCIYDNGSTSSIRPRMRCCAATARRRSSAGRPARRSRSCAMPGSTRRPRASEEDRRADPAPGLRGRALHSARPVDAADRLSAHPDRRAARPAVLLERAQRQA